MNAYKHGGRSAEVRDIQKQFINWEKDLTQLIGLAWKTT